MPRIRPYMAALLLLGFIACPGQAALGHTPEERVKVSTKPFVPFVMEGSGGYTGFSVELWDLIAQELEIEYEFVGRSTVDELLADVHERRADVAIAGITITSRREERVDFSHAFFNSGLQILVRDSGEREVAFIQILKPLVSWGFVQLFGVALLVLLLSAHLLWWVERKRNPYMFPPTYIKGVWEAFWWAVVTVTTVGYGDRIPKSVPGRLVAMFWMWMGILLFSSFTASVTTSLTLQSLQGTINGPADLPGRVVATIPNTTAAQYLRTRAVHVVEVDTIALAYKALEDGEVEAVVYDSPVLRYYASHKGRGKVRVVGPIFEEQSYGIALPQGSPMREPIGRALLTLQENGTYTTLHTRWFGEQR